jgi:hypothetical protein
MNNLIQNPGRFFKVVASKQAYLNLIYLLAAFPLGIFYFVFLISGLSTGISLVIIWVGIPILLLVGIAWWGLAVFERFMAVHLLNEDIPVIEIPSTVGSDKWTRFKEYLIDPVTWKSLLYLFMKFPLGIFTFVVLATVISLTLAFLAMPFLYEFMEYSQAGVFLGGDLPYWRIDSMGDALIAAFIGLMLWPVTMHIINALAWVHAKFARVMLSNDPIGGFTAIAASGHLLK